MKTGVLLSYDIADLFFYKMSLGKGQNELFEIEGRLTHEEKLMFLDSFEEGAATYLFNLIQQWENEKESLPNAQDGNVTTDSKVEWIRQNDYRNILDNQLEIGSYYGWNKKYHDLATVVSREVGSSNEYQDMHIIDSWFHDLCQQLANQEQEYFELQLIKGYMMGV